MKQKGRRGRGILLVVMLLLVLGGITLGWGGFERLTPVLGKAPDQAENGESVACERRGRILLITADGRQSQLYGDGDAALGPWSPDGTRVAILTGLYNDGEWRQGNPMLLSPAGERTPVVSTRGKLLQGDGEAAWNSAGMLVVATAGGLYLGTPDAGYGVQARPWFTPYGKNTAVWHPRRVPQSDAISCWITAGDGISCQVEARLVLISPQGTIRRAIFRTMIWAGSDPPVDILWSPDGRRGLVYADSIAGLNWFLVDQEGHSRRVLSPAASDPCWLDSGRLLYREQSDNRFLVLDLSQGSSRPFPLPPWVEWVKPSPGGRRLLLAGASANKGRWDLYTANPDGSGINLLVTGAGEAEWRPR